MRDELATMADPDGSVNFIRRAAGGAFESRFVQRDPSSYFIAYVSSQAGCERSCRFCHLTATGQTSSEPATHADFAAQLLPVLGHWVALGRPGTGRLNVNFMARGEPLMNPILRRRGDWLRLTAELTALAAAHGADDVRFNVSTIMPREPDGGPPPLGALAVEGTTIYYSLYSLRREFRRRWLPKACDPMAALASLARWQDRTGLDLALHWAFIEGENDDLGTVEEIAEVLSALELRAKFNAVRYNPYSERHGRESAAWVVERNHAILAGVLGHPHSRIVPRVGPAAKASCGMFAAGSEIPA